jgi:hypothetical protein
VKRDRGRDPTLAAIVTGEKPELSPGVAAVFINKRSILKTFSSLFAGDRGSDMRATHLTYF